MDLLGGSNVIALCFFLLAVLVTSRDTVVPLQLHGAFFTTVRTAYVGSCHNSELNRVEQPGVVLLSVRRTTQPPHHVVTFLTNLACYEQPMIDTIF